MKAAGLIFVLFAVFGCSAKPGVVEPAVGGDSSRTSKLYVVSHGWHVGIAIAADELSAVIPELAERFGGPEYYELGWGDAGFYQAGETTAGLALRAVIWSRGTVLHVAALSDSPAEYFPPSSVVETCLNAEEAKSLAQYLASSFARNGDGNLVELKRGLYGDSQFYDAEGRYHLLNTSNKWAAKALKSAGMDLSPTFKLTADSVMDYVKENRRECNLSSS